MRSLIGLLDTIKQMRYEATGYVDPYTRYVAEKHLAEIQIYVTDLLDAEDITHFDPNAALAQDFASINVRVRKQDLERVIAERTTYLEEETE